MPPNRPRPNLLAQMTDEPEQIYPNKHLTSSSSIDEIKFQKRKRFLPYKHRFSPMRRTIPPLSEQRHLPSMSQCLTKSMPLVERLKDQLIETSLLSHLPLEACIRPRIDQTTNLSISMDPILQPDQGRQPRQKPTKRDSFRRLQLQPDQQRILDLLEDWASNPTYVIRKILLSPGCPDFPPDQWLNIVKGQAVDLSKVLGAHYSTEVETKQSHDLGELFQVSVQLPKQSKAIKSHGDWVIAFGKTIQATAYALPP
ncbi:hypothetical protein EV363DRAFT_1453200 [Boletus edulis]|nr:hypothetical protein EV363DRAFT_1453200 [Boletus edulis]